MSIINDVVDFIKSVFGKIPGKIKEYAEKAISIVDTIKNALNSDTVNDILALLPGEWDSDLRDQALKLLEGLTDILKQIDASEVDEQAKATAKAGIYLKMSSKLVELQDGKELKPNRYDFYTQTVYSKHKS